MESGLKTVKNILNQYKLKPQHFRGQNFLINSQVVDKLITVAALAKSDTVLEIGPGLGILTEQLVEKAKEVWTVEVDRNLVAVLQKKFSQSTIKIITGNILQIYPKLEKDLPADYKIVSNLPFRITSRFLRIFLEAENAPQSMTLIVQLELAKRICAEAGRLSLISVAVQFYGRPRIIKEVGRQEFWPEPKVDTAILQIDQIGQSYCRQLKAGLDKKFWQLARIGFSARRKQLSNNLASGLKVEKQQIEKLISKSAI
ncbi:ribosomal RNA small subunit methyltransferase A [Patescibacteria group bacterium]|nr:ribosomal RNA small subunit methyltransferase A [Patescibacteria group bacterium]